MLNAAGSGLFVVCDLTDKFAEKICNLRDISSALPLLAGVFSENPTIQVAAKSRGWTARSE